MKKRALFNNIFNKSTLYKLPILAIVSILINLYFYYPSHIIFLPKEQPIIDFQGVEMINGRTYLKYEFELCFTNKSFKKGSVEGFEIYPEGIPVTSYRILSSIIDKNTIKRGEKVRVHISFTLEQTSFIASNTNKSTSERLVMRFFAEDGTHITHKNGEIAYIITGTIRSTDKNF